MEQPLHHLATEMLRSWSIRCMRIMHNNPYFPQLHAFFAPQIWHRYLSETDGKGRLLAQRTSSMFLATLISMFTAPKTYVWQPAVTMTDPTIVSALIPSASY
ncbi:MAG: hypothetical protein ACRCUE_14780 [Bosea sp. (in: a-proteobacteria)]